MQETPEFTNPEVGPEAGGDAADLEQRLRQAELNAAEHHDAWLRAKAEGDNIRKRSQTEIANAHTFVLRTSMPEAAATCSLSRIAHIARPNFDIVR